MILCFKYSLIETNTARAPRTDLFAATEDDEKIQRLAGFSDVKRASNAGICNKFPLG
jgi:hypothetical protein